MGCVSNFEEFGKIRSLEFVKKYVNDYESIENNVLAGIFGKTAHSWFQYCNLVNLQQLLHYVINTSYFD